MGILDFFRKKTPQEKTIIQLTKDKKVLDKVIDAITLLGGLERRISDFFDSMERTVRQGIMLRDAIERHGFLVGWEGRKMTIDPHETPVVMRMKTEKWKQIKEKADVLLDTLASLRYALQKKKADFGVEQRLSELLRAQFDEFSQIASDNIHTLWADLHKYPELIDKKTLDANFEKFRQQINKDFSIINRLIESIIVAERNIYPS